MEDTCSYFLRPSYCVDSQAYFAVAKEVHLG